MVESACRAGLGQHPRHEQVPPGRRDLLTENNLKRLLITLLKIALSAAILGYLVWNSTRGEKNVNVFANLRNQPKDWPMLAAAWACCTAAVLLTFVRWWYLVRALDIPCRFADAIRISFWGYLFNLAPLGIVAGDLVKAVMLDHEHRGHRAKALASVLVDRIIGLYVLFVVATAAILLTGFWRIDDPLIWWVCKLTFLPDHRQHHRAGRAAGPGPERRAADPACWGGFPASAAPWKA